MALTLPANARPRILLLIDQRGWAFDTIAQAISRYCSDRFHFEILASAEAPVIDASKYDLVHVFYFGERYHLPFLTPSTKVIKSVYSFRWQLSGLSPDDLYAEYLREAHAVTVPNSTLLSLLADLPVPVFLTQEGVDTDLFHSGSVRTGPLIAGWAGNSRDPIKQFLLAVNSCKGLCELKIADGSLPVSAMPAFYREIDILLCSSLAEGSPRPLLEAMSSGVFPVTFPVGIARETIVSGESGLIVEEADQASLRQAILWCRDHADLVRSVSGSNPDRMRKTRAWEHVANQAADVYSSQLLL